MLSRRVSLSGLFVLFVCFVVKVVVGGGAARRMVALPRAERVGRFRSGERADRVRSR